MAAGYKDVRPTEQKKHLIQSKQNMAEWKSWNHDIPQILLVWVVLAFFTLDKISSFPQVKKIHTANI